ncbi:MAG: radical SAM protein [Candidatus Omnitrophota bacterium]
MFYSTKNAFLIKLLYLFQPYPPFIEIEVTTRCNLRCLICEHTYWHEPSRDMPFEQFKSIVDQFPKLKWIGLTGIGESFLNKDFMRMLRYVKSKNIFVELYDTFYFIDEEAAKELVELPIDKIFVSLDAATKETYEKIRVGSDFDRVIGNVKYLIKIKMETKSYFPEIAFHYIISKENVNEVSNYIELVSSLAQGQDVSIQFTRMLHSYPEVEGLFTEVPEEIIEAVKVKARELGSKVSWNADIPSSKPVISKCTEWMMPFVFVTGHVIPCCSGNEAGNREFQKQTALGNVFEKSFMEIWQGKKYKVLREKLRKGDSPLPCKNCCLYDTGQK